MKKAVGNGEIRYGFYIHIKQFIAKIFNFEETVESNSKIVNIAQHSAFEKVYFDLCIDDGSFWCKGAGRL
jgi:hypothetical protein